MPIAPVESLARLGSHPYMQTSPDTATSGPRPKQRLAILTCMDARIDPPALLGLRLGDAHVIRNAGGLVTLDAIRSLAASQRVLGTEKIVLLMHEDCGLHGASDAEFADALAADGATPDWRLGGFADLEQALAEGVRRLRTSPELPHREDIRALIFDPSTGDVREPELPAGQAHEPEALG
jgi:carbonic anhydrase